MTMAARLEIILWISCVAIAAAPFSDRFAMAIGVNWGTMMSNPIPPDIVVRMLKDNGITKVKLFDSDSWTVTALANSGIEVMVGIPNNQLQRMNSYNDARDWVNENVTSYIHNRVDIRYVAVGNEPFLSSYNGSFLHTTFPALKNIQKALNDAGFGGRVKATVPFNADVYYSPDDNLVPSAGDFRPDIRDLMVDMVKFLDANGAPFLVNIYPFLSLFQNEHFPINFAFFDDGGNTVNDRGKQYSNAFEANFDTLVWTLNKAGATDTKIVVGEIGWPTDGDKNANPANARKFYNGILRKLAQNTGTPMRPGHMEAYLFSLLDENMKSVLPGHFERHWGIFSYDGKPKFPMDLSGKGWGDKYLVGAKGVEYIALQWCVLDEDQKDEEKLKELGQHMEYACSLADCTPLSAGSSCFDLDSHARASYAFNVYFQMQQQDVRACDFNGLAKITTKNASRNGCLFPVEIVSGARRAAVGNNIAMVVMLFVTAAVALLTA